MATLGTTIKNRLKQCVLYCIHAYRYCLSPMMGFHCRFYPSCSNYAFEAIQIYGLGKGSYLTLRRILRCHPYHHGGIDFVPLKKK